MRGAALAGVLLGGASGSSAAEPEPIHGATAVTAPDRSDAGNWTGTWYYVSRTHRIALWLREDGEQLQIRLQLQSSQMSSVDESFLTDWNGVAEYAPHGRPAKFALRIAEHDKNTIRGTWNWEVDRGGKGFSEHADFSVYRAGAGRLLVWKMENLSRETDNASKTKPLDEVVWVFDKVSQRPAVLWSELPY